MATIRFIQHSHLSNDDLVQIIHIKSKAWPYSFDKQVDWIKANLKDQDQHALLLNNNNDLIAYLNLIDIVVIIDNKLLPSWGIGNVCASEKGKGWGKDIMMKINVLLSEEGKTGLLFCKDPLINFYKGCDWKLIEPEKWLLPMIDSVNGMMFNYGEHFENITFTGKLF